MDDIGSFGVTDDFRLERDFRLEGGSGSVAKVEFLLLDILMPLQRTLEADPRIPFGRFGR